MSVDKFLDNLCDITVKDKVRSGGEDTINEDPVYTGEICHFFRYNPKLTDTNASSNTELAGIKVILQPDKTLVKIGMYLYLNDPELGLIGKYTIEGVKMDRLISGEGNQIVLTCKRI